MTDQLTTLDVLRQFIRENPGPAIIYFVTLLLVPLYDVGLPHVYGNVLQALQHSQPLLKPVTHLLMVIVIIHIGILIAEWNDTYNTYHVLHLILRKAILSNMFLRNEHDFDDQRTASLITRVVQLPSTMYGLIEQYKMALVPQILVTIIIVVYFCLADVKLGLGVLCFILIMAYVIWRSPSACQEAAVNRETQTMVLHDTLDDLLRNMMAIFNANTYAQEETELDELHHDIRKLSGQTQLCITRHKLMLAVLQIGIFVFFMGRCVQLLHSKQLLIPKFVSLFLIMMSLNTSITRCVSQVKELVTRHGVLNASKYYLETQRDSKSSAGRVDGVGIDETGTEGGEGGALVLKHVTFQYHPDSPHHVLNDVSFEIPYGQRVLIMGPIGCGKSTLLKLIMKYKRPNSGQLYLGGVPYNQLHAKTIRSRIGYVPQIAQLFHRSIYDNIVYGSEHTTNKKDLQNLLEQLDLSHVFDNMPLGLESSAGKNGSHLSGGQRQIVWILRVMLQNPELLLLDEPTASIDDKTKDMVINLLKHVMQGRTVIMVTHDPSLTSFATRILSLDHGTLSTS